MSQAKSNDIVPSIYVAHSTIEEGTTTSSQFPQWMINYTFDGRCDWSSSAETHEVTGGQLIVTRPNTAMTWRATATPRSGPTGVVYAKKPWTTAYTVFNPRPHWLPWLDGFDFNAGMAHIVPMATTVDDVHDAMMHLVTSYEIGGFLRDERALSALEDVLLSLQVDRARAETARDNRIAAAIEYIHTHFGVPTSVFDIADHVGLSASRLTAIFSAATGTSPIKYLEETRLSRAAEMLTYGALKIGDVAVRVSYDDPNYFARRFAMRFGQSPRQYRESSRKAGNQSLPAAGG